MSSKLNSGAYQLYINVSKRITIKIGALGSYTFEKGTYIYTGSAMKNLEQRINRHLRLNKTKDKSKRRWHIDYLLCNPNVKIRDIKKYRSTKKDECMINQTTATRLKGIFPIKSFGSSDCKKCISHLSFIDNFTY